MSSRKKKIDPMLYMGYADEKESIESIEAKFAMMENKEREGDLSAEESAKSVFLETVTPDQIPLDVWFDLENYGEEEEQLMDDIYEPGYYDGDEDIPRSMRRSHSRGSGESGGLNFANFTQIDHLGSGIELWPDYKLRSVDCDKNTAMISAEFPNVQEGLSYERFQDICEKCPITTIPKMTPKAIYEIAGNNIDAIIMDVPFGHNGWTGATFYQFLREMKNTIGQSFFVIWADPEHLPDVVGACTRLELKFCDSISCELLSPMGDPVSIELKNGFHRETRMLVMYRTDDISRNDLAQQRIKDTGWGISVRGGKTYDRYSMPMVAHQIIETMLPQKKNKRRVFVELWPSTYNRRNGWTMINEAEYEK
ncbi:hypothetical protein TVAG_312160 [Trichomonas vaginalis G3]|uniref:Uncharacterized protein n=1 Tax=Trichomonas vaginalis (strain ATCC PRA-98 / G3) TaxID=412133 RepID=A2EHM1_TRIV3|nr:hypothetical protein TVAGG3_0242360 [Trichomonas vaginalis G3]EAY07817.1 hypothetical protein TVAG_312160 [Trichomonas vaginalis G3]KAI5553427.1 hypothetical protein TVAGG3_0242360 [Trichomonas vaginalis G3]|eukprot:XP_001320040.1 hypothetical protein [Trichomonas vaginalis G3]